MKFKYRPYCDKDLLSITPKLYQTDSKELFGPTAENTLTVLQNDQIVAFMDVLYFSDINVHSINMFEVFNPRKGIGSQIINEIQMCENVTCIVVNPNSLEAVKFWRKMGFAFIDDETMQWRKGQTNEII